MIAHQPEAAALFDEANDGVHFRVRVGFGRRLEDQHVNLCEQAVAEHRKVLVHLVEMAQVTHQLGVVVDGLHAVALGVQVNGRPLPVGMVFVDHDPAGFWFTGIVETEGAGKTGPQQDGQQRSRPAEPGQGKRLMFFTVNVRVLFMSQRWD